MLASRILLVAFLLPSTALIAPRAGAQIRASERGSVSQTVDGTVITVDYGRAQARGRDSLFGKVITRDEVWTPGANAATTVQVSRDVTVGGKRLPAGKYSLWLVSDPASEWVFYFHTDATLWHTAHPSPAAMALAVPVPHTTTGEHVEVLTFDFPRVSPRHAELRLRWGTTTVPLDIGITPSAPAIALTPEQLAPYLGTYAVTFPAAKGGGRSPEMKLAIVNAKGALRGIIDLPQGEPMELEYLPTGTPHRFMPAFLKDGKIFDVEVMPVEFQVVDGRATGFSMMFDGKPWMEGRRKD
jgi:hypothetical protein